MWSWLRKKPSPLPDDLRRLTDQVLGPPSLAVALAEIVRDYVAAVRAGKLSYPAHRREGASVVEIWAALRIEALHKLFNFGRSDPFLLSEQRWQDELLTCFLDDRVHLEMPQPRGAVIPDTIQAMFQVYLYLSDVGAEVGDRETDREALAVKRRSILDQIETECAQLRLRRSAFRSSTGESPMPHTMIELLFQDITAKAKSIALSTRFGPYYERGINFVEEQIARDGADIAPFKASVAQLLAARDPDDLSK